MDPKEKKEYTELFKSFLDYEWLVCEKRREANRLVFKKQTDVNNIAGEILHLKASRRAVLKEMQKYPFHRDVIISLIN